MLNLQAVKNASETKKESIVVSQPDNISEDTNSTAASDQLTPELAAMVFTEIDPGRHIYIHNYYVCLLMHKLNLIVLACLYIVGCLFTYLL